MPTTDQITPILPGRSPIYGRGIEARFDGALISNDGGLLVLHEIKQLLGIAEWLVAYPHISPAPKRIVHGLDEAVHFRILKIAAGYEDDNDADGQRTDPLFKLAIDRLPERVDPS